MPQGNPEGFRTSVPEDVQEIVIATIHRLFREHMHGFSFTFKEDKEVFIISKLNCLSFGYIPYSHARQGGIDLLMEYAKFIEENFNDGEEAEVQEGSSERQDPEAI